MSHSSAERLRAAERAEPLAALRRRARDAPPPPPLTLTTFDLIAEIKLAAPSVGPLVPADAAPLPAITQRAAAYARAGAAVISVLTEPTRFAGDLAHLSAVAGTVGVPVMRKDFLIDPYQLFEARAAGAAGALLILRMSVGGGWAAPFPELLDAAAEAGLFILLEAFDRADLDHARSILADRPSFFPKTPPILLGLNARDLTTLRIDPNRLFDLASNFPPGVPRVAESGLATPDDARRLARAGYHAALVGSALMRAPDPEPLARAILAAGRGPQTSGAGFQPAVPPPPRNPHHP